MQVKDFSAGTRLFSQGDYSEDAYRILDGTVEISIDKGASQLVLAKLEAGQIFGEMGMIERQPRSATAQALTALTVEVITEQDFNTTLTDGGEKLVPYLTTIFERLRVTNERLRAALEQLETEDGATSGPSRNGQTHASADGACILLEPDSEETRAQSTLQAQTLKVFPYFLGRRADLAACVDVFSKNHLLIGDRVPFRVSRNHCVIECKKGAFVVHDRGSHLGTLVNGIRIGGGSKESSARLSPGKNTLVLGRSNSAIRFSLTVPAAK
jgi:CRP-like cAMP-binding protein